jgi:hypothetical protein
MTRDVITAPCEKNSARRIHRDDLLHDKLRRFETTKFVDVESIGHLDHTSIRRARLVERNSINGISARRRPNLKLQMILANGSLLVDLKIAGKYRFGETGAPGTCLPKHPCEF